MGPEGPWEDERGAFDTRGGQISRLGGLVNVRIGCVRYEWVVFWYKCEVIDDALYEHLDVFVSKKQNGWHCHTVFGYLNVFAGILGQMIQLNRMTEFLQTHWILVRTYKWWYYIYIYIHKLKYIIDPMPILPHHPSLGYVLSCLPPGKQPRSQDFFHDIFRGTRFSSAPTLGGLLSCFMSNQPTPPLTYPPQKWGLIKGLLTIGFP